MRPSLSCCLVVTPLLLASIASAELADTNAMLGFSREAATRERALEARFDSHLHPADLPAWMERMTARPHHVGSPFDKDNAEFIASQFKAWGYQTEIEQFEVLFPTPKLRQLEMTEPETFKAVLAEPPLKEDATSGQTREELPVYNAYSVDGDVQGDLVYVNYGVPKDYEILAEKGVDVKGRIVIARYGGSWRGIKPKVAAEHGAIGCLIYSDPRDDGYFNGDTYPRGAWRNSYGAQRGSVEDMPVFPGDPLTPGIGATKNAKRLALKDAPTLTKIPVLPIAYADAEPLLRQLTGPVAPEDWRGALPFTYHLGPGPAKVHLRLEFDWKLRTLYDVIARMPGAARPEEWILRGNHHDAWVFGADDPISGTVALMEEARGLGELAREGWQPKRTVIYTVWDGEEPGLIGSTEWVETHAELLRQHAAVYVNSDNNGRGFLNVAGSHTLERMVNQVARVIADPERGMSVEDRLRAARIVKATTADERRELRDRADLRIEALGSGSDYTPFLQHLGIASLDVRYGGENGGGSYHSIYDSFDHYRRFGDPNFQYGLALARTAGRIVLRLADAEVLPFEFEDFSDTIAKYVREVTKLADDLQAETEEKNREITDHALEAAADPTLTYVVPQPKDPVPFLAFAPLQNAVARLQQHAKHFAEALSAATRDGQPLTLDLQTGLDAIFQKLEQALTREDGLPRRPWYKHFVYAPGLYTGYGVKTLPGVREAIEQRHWSEANEQIQLAARTLDRFTDQIDRATALLGPTRGQ